MGTIRRVIKGTSKHTAKSISMWATEGSISFNAAKKVNLHGEEGGVLLGDYAAPELKVEESNAKLKSTYVFDHLKSVAQEVIADFNSDNTGIVYQIYKSIVDGKIDNPEIIVSKRPINGKKAGYDPASKKIIVFEAFLQNIAQYNSNKIQLIHELTQAYEDYINAVLKEEIKVASSLETYDYDLFCFDAFDEQPLSIAYLESENHTGDLEISFKEDIEERKKESIQFRQSRAHHGPAGGDLEMISNEHIADGWPPNVGIKFGYSLGGGFTISFYAGISKTKRVGEWGAMASLNTALTLYTKGAPGTSPYSPYLLNFTASPALTIGCKTGNALDMNLFNQFSGSGVKNPFEYSFTLGNNFVLSTGRESPSVNPETGEVGTPYKNPYNKHDNPNRHQILGAAEIRIGNFSIASYNDIKKPPLFFGMDSDQYWSAGANVQMKIKEDTLFKYAFDLYYGKSNNKNPYIFDKLIDGQNYDYQSLYDLLLNKGQEKLIIESSKEMQVASRTGYGTFWPSNNMHNTIPWPEAPKEPKAPVEPPENASQEIKDKYNNDVIVYKNKLAEYEGKDNVYRANLRLKPNSSFHHLWVTYKDGESTPDASRIIEYLNAKQPDLSNDLEFITSKENLDEN